MCFIQCISIIFLNSFNKLVFIKEVQSVFCEVETTFLYTF